MSSLGISVRVWVYILRSEGAGRFYCGQTRNLEKRVAQHNDPTHRLTLTTKRFEGPWELVWSIDTSTGSEATKLERAIKKRGISRYLKDLASEKASGC